MPAKREKAGYGPLSGEQRSILIVCMATMFLAPFMSSALNLSITDISSEFNTGATTTTWVINAYTIGTAAFSMPLGNLADRTGRRRMIIIGTSIFLSFSLVCMLAPNIWVLIGGRLAMSVGAAFYLAGNTPLMLTYFSPDDKGRMLGITITAVYSGLALGPVIGGIINDALGWRWIFLIVIIIAVIALLAVLFKVSDDSMEAEGPMDRFGSALFVIAVSLLMMGITEANTHLWARVMLVAGIALLVVFVLHEAHTAQPVVQVRLFVGNPVYGLGNLACLLSFGACFSVGYVMAVYLENVQGMDAATAGLLMIVQPAFQAIFAPWAGRLSDRHPARFIAFIGMLVILAGLVVLCFVRVGYPVWLVIAAMAIIGVGNAFFATPNNNAVLSCVDESHYSEANSTIATMRGMGQSLSIATVGLVFSATVGNTVFTQIPPADLASAISAVMVVGVIVAIVAAACSLAHSREDKAGN